MRQDILRADSTGKALEGRRPSAETRLHLQVYDRFADVGAVLHPHTVNATLLSQLAGDALELQDYELLKAFPGVGTHACRVNVPVFDNDQDIARLAARVDAFMDENPLIHGYLTRGHGFYTWCCASGGDLISVPAGTTHWFDMGSRPDFTCIRFFTTPEGWIGNFTGSDTATRFPDFDSFAATS